MKAPTVVKRLARRLFAAPELAKTANIQINGSGEFIMSGCRAIRGYDKEHADLVSFGVCVRVKGEDLELAVLSEKTVALFGKIVSVELVDRL